MIIRPQTRPQLLLRALAKPSLLSASRTQTRSLHRVPELPQLADWEQNGVAGLLTKQSFNTNWIQYQSHLCDGLNQKTLGTPDEPLTARQLLSKYSRDASHASLFNTASQATNNHFFFEALANATTDPSPSLTKEISDSFPSGLDELRNELVETADAMFGNGYVWLIKETNWQSGSKMRILATYNAGSPFKDAHYRAQTRDMNNTSSILAGRNTAGSFGNSSAYAPKTHSGALEGEPLLCLSVWQHMWVPDYGLLGKRSYLISWWLRINWEKVESRLNDVKMAAMRKSAGGGELGGLVQRGLNRGF